MEFFDDTVNTKNAKSDMGTQIELITSFFNSYSDEKELGFYQSMVVDLYRAITCYRMYDSLEEFMAINPELNDCRDDIEELWKEFAKLTDSELSEVALELLKDL